jgi:hypothetical protein
MNWLKRLTLTLLLLTASVADAQYMIRDNCNTLTPVESGTVCLQRTTTGGLTAGHVYVYRGATWTDVDSGGAGSGDIEGVTAGTNLSGGGTSGTVTLNVVNPIVANLTGNVTGNVTGSSGSTTGNAATVTTNANLTGHVTSVGNAAVLGSFTVAQLNTAISDGDVATGGGTATGTNTGDQTITLTGDVTGSGTGSFAATIAANSVALGTDTTGDYVSSATASQGLLLTGTEGASLGLIDCAANEIIKRNAGDTAWECAADSTGGSPSFDTIASGTNTTAAMVVGTGGSLAVSGSGTIAATTAAALAANPSDCAANQFATTIAANGNLTCAAIVDADVPNNITIDLAATVTTNANLTGHVTSTGNAAVLGSFTVAQLNTAISDGDVATGGGTATGTNTGDQTSVSGNAGTATALAANGGNCSAGSFPLGVDASGAVESCTALPTTISGTANEITASAATGAVTLSIPAVLDLSGKVLSGASPLVFEGATPDAFETTIAITDPTVDRTFTIPDADSVAIQPSGAVSNQFITGVSAAGVISRAQPAFTDISGAVTDAQVPNTITVDLATAATALAANGTNCTAGNYARGVDASGNAEDCTAASGGGDALVANPLSQFAATTSAQLAGVISDESGTGALIFAGGAIGAATATTPSADDNDTSVATTAYVQTELTAYASDTVSLTNKTLDAEGTGNVVTIPFTLWLPMAGCSGTTAGTIWDLPTSGPMVATCTVGTNTVQGYGAFADSASLSAQYTWAVPSDWTGNIDVRFKWFTAATSGDVVWQLATICVADAETNDPAFNTASTVTDTAKGTTLQTNDAAITTLTVTGCAAGELMHFKILRDSAHASDTLAATANLIGIEMKYRRAM